MEFESIYISPEIKLSSYKGTLFNDDVIFGHHMLVWPISGETKIITANKTYIFNAREIFLFPRNLLATILCTPKDGLPHKAAVMHITVERLREFYRGRKVVVPALGKKDELYKFNAHPLLESCLQSLIPYFELGTELPEEISSLKINEAITILRSIDKGIDTLFTDFDEPGKIDLAGFMERNYMFNMPLDKFSYLTGRSVTTFRRDFKKVFKTTPQKWLTRKRLELAHYQIREKLRKPSEVYLETGFENLSHFSYAFKKQFGYVPTEALR